MGITAVRMPCQMRPNRLAQLFAQLSFNHFRIARDGSQLFSILYWYQYVSYTRRNAASSFSTNLPIGETRSRQSYGTAKNCIAHAST
jgi:hypothetical protein